jgi:hypothetical protein
MPAEAPKHSTPGLHRQGSQLVDSVTHLSPGGVHGSHVNSEIRSCPPAQRRTRCPSTPAETCRCRVRTSDVGNGWSRTLRRHPLHILPSRHSAAREGSACVCPGAGGAGETSSDFALVLTARRQVVLLEEPCLVGEHDRLYAVAEAELLKDVCDVRLDGGLADVELVPDLRV